MPTTESAVRSRLTRKGYALHKARTRNEDHPAFGLYNIRDPFTNTIVEGSGTWAYELTLEDAAEVSVELDRNWRM